MKRYEPHFFNETDFVNCTPSCSIEDMDLLLLMKLDFARHYLDAPIVLNSAYRSPEWELEHGRKGTSSHTKGFAVDIRCPDIFYRMRLVRALIQAGFFRIGVADTYVHADIDFTKPGCMWLY